MSAGLVGLRRGGRVWALADVLADGFAAQTVSMWWFAPGLCTRLLMAAQLMIADRHVAADASAVAMLGSGRRAGAIAARVVAAVVAVFALLLVLAVVVGVWAPLAVAVLLFGLMSRGLPRVWAERKARRRLRALRPPGARLVHSVVRARWALAGRGRELLEELHAIADEKGWLLVLETEHPRLVAYYERLGYRRVGVGESMRSGATRWAMVRTRMEVV